MNIMTDTSENIIFFRITYMVGKDKTKWRWKCVDVIVDHVSGIS